MAWRETWWSRPARWRSAARRGPADRGARRAGLRSDRSLGDPQPGAGVVGIEDVRHLGRRPLVVLGPPAEPQLPAGGHGVDSPGAHRPVVVHEPSGAPRLE